MTGSTAAGWVALALALALLGCGGSSTPQLVSRATATQGDWKAELLSTAPLTAGLNRVSYRLTQGGAAVTAADLTQTPLMTMPSMHHGAPQVAPASSANADGLFEGVVVFTMPSSDTEVWSLGLGVTLPGGGTSPSLTFDHLAVAESSLCVASLVGSDSYLYTLSFPDARPRVGKNTVTVSVHRPHDSSEMAYDAVDDLGVTLVPEMPAMGHGTTGNVQPAGLGDGLYQGTANLNMAGDWVMHLTLAAPGGAQLLAHDFSFSL